MAILSVTSWCESGPWCVGSRMTSPSSTPDRQISFYCNIHRGHHQITAAHTHRFPQATGTQMSMTVLLGNPQQQQVCVCVFICLFGVSVQPQTSQKWTQLLLNLEGFQMCSHAFFKSRAVKQQADKNFKKNHKTKQSLEI